MDQSQIESWSFGRSEAAAMVGISEIQVGNYIKRYDLFPGRPRGKGHHVCFRLRELMTLKAVSILIEHNVAPEQAAAALRSHAGPYSALLQDGFGPDGRKPLFTYPGTLFFTRNDEGRWVQVDGPDKPICIQIRAWPIFDELWPRVRAQILVEGTSEPKPYPGDVEAGLKAFEDRIAKIRAERWGEMKEA